MCSARWIQCEEMTNRMGFLSKHPTTQKPIPSPFINIGINYMNQAVRLWNEIFQIVKETAARLWGGLSQDDLMERLLRARKGERMTKTTTEMQLVPITKLVPYVNNARTHSPEQITKLRSSLREFGFINPIIIDRDFNVIAGHGRILAATEEGITEVPCVFADYLSEAQKKAYIIADNRMAMDAGWDEELLRVEIESLAGIGL